MKRVLVCFMLVFLLTGCHTQKFSLESSTINLEHELDDVLDEMMDKGNYNQFTKSPYNGIFLAIDYSNRSTILERFSFAVYGNKDLKDVPLKSTGCSNEQGILQCKEHPQWEYSVEEREQEVLLVNIVDSFSRIDIAEIVSEVESHYDIANITYSESVLITFRLALPEDIEETQSYSENISYMDSIFHYETFTPTDMMIRIRVSVFYEDDGEAFFFYKDID